MAFLYNWVMGGKPAGQKSSTVAEAVTSARTSYPNSGPPGLGAPSAGVEYGGIPNRGAMMRDIDAMMPFTQAPGAGVPSVPEPPNPYAPGGSRHVPWMDGPDSRSDIGIGRTNFPSWSPEVSQGFNPQNPYSWAGVPGGGSVVPPGTENFLTSTDWTSGITPPSAQTFPSASSYIPDPEFGAVNQYSPAPVNSPFAGAGDPLLADTTTQYDFMAGMNPATGAMAPGSAGAAWTPTGYDVMAGMDPATGPMGYGANPDPYGPLGDRYVPFQSGSPNEQTDVGMGIFPENDDFRGPPDPGGVRRIYEDSEDATRADMGPLANNLERTAVDYDVAREYDKTSKEINKRLADQRIAEHEARFGAMKAEEAERQEKYLEDLAKIQKKQRMFMVLGALSGDPNLARIAGTIAQQDMAVLNQKYEWASGDRTAQMQQALMYNSNGEYDPPESRQELYSALSTMGATSTEMGWFDGQFFGADRSPDTTYRNFTNTSTGQRYSGYGPPDESGEWAITGQYDYGTSDNDTPGGVDMEKYLIWQEAKQKNEAGDMSDEQLKDLEKALGFEQKDIKLNQEFSMFESIYKDSRFGWQLPGLTPGEFPTAKEIEDQFAKFQKEVLPALKGAKRGGPADEAKDEVVLVSTDADFKKLKKGDKYRVEGDPEGKYRTKGSD